MNNTAIHFRSLCKSFVNHGDSTVTALDAVDISCPTGQISCAVGPSGCGKTTLLRLAAGLLQPDSGEINISGRPAGNAQNIGMVSQEGNLLPWRTIAGNIALGLELLGSSDRHQRRQRALEMMAHVGLDASLAGSYPHELSGGMRQRAALARALCPQPQILLMDEPLSSLDEPTRHELQLLLWNLCRQDKLTLLFVTHNIEEAVFLADKLIIMQRASVAATIDNGQPQQPRNRLSDSFNQQVLNLRRELHQQ